jgi:hypothetical protein
MKSVNYLYGLLMLLTAVTIFQTTPALASSCLSCHENQARMKELGFEQFAVSAKAVQAQTHHRGIGCQSCHLGNPEAGTKEEAHKGLARLLVVRKKGFIADTSPRKYPLTFGESPTTRVFVATDKNGQKTRDAEVQATSWHDKRPDTLAVDFEQLKKSCGSCHPKQFAEFSTSTMGTMGKQSSYAGWTDKHGPHNCGPWFEGNFEAMQLNTGLKMSKESHAINQKVCNTCHTGCLDCHFNPQPKDPKNLAIGSHTFAKTPPSMSCYGGGRANLCHAGPEDNRRGAGTYGGAFSIPEGNSPDVHVKANVGCLDCHSSSKSDKSLPHGVVKRQAQASCVTCHKQAVTTHAGSIHKNLSCEACHIQQVAGYQATYWGPGKLAGAETPFFKYKGYQGIMPQPILIKNQKGIWIPVKPFPMAVVNQKESPFKPGLYWRYPANLPDDQRTDDAWAYTGLHGGLTENNKALTWIQMDKLSHKLGKARSCESCHAHIYGVQQQKVTWEYVGPGAAPFKGSHTVVATNTSLRIQDIQAHDRIEVEKGYKMSSLAPWAWLDVWEVAGDFTIPAIKDRAAYDKLKNNLQGARGKGLLHR